MFLGAVYKYTYLLTYFTVTVLGPDLIILNLPTIMTIEMLLIEWSFAIPVALPNT